MLYLQRRPDRNGTASVLTLKKHIMSAINVCTPGNPRDVTEQEIVELYKKVL
ncbi:MAG: hypothetical protein MJY55_03910 [Bacteroidales bacterium]|nr:hypothetical protein [Bacteroidales bacterium]